MGGDGMGGEEMGGEEDGRGGGWGRKGEIWNN